MLKKTDKTKKQGHFGLTTDFLIEKCQTISIRFIIRNSQLIAKQ